MNLIKKVFSSEIKAIDETNMELTALVSTNAVDRYREVIDPDGMDAKNFRKNPVVLWAHDYSQPPIGKALWIKKEGDGIVSKVKFADTARGKEIFQLYKDGFMKAFSIGFIPMETENMPMDDPMTPEKPQDHKKPRKIYRKWELLEYSAVPIPANPEALQLCIQRGLVAEDEKTNIITHGFDNIDSWNETETASTCDGITITEKGTDSFDELMTEIMALKSTTDELTALLKDKDAEINRLSLCIYNLNAQIKHLKSYPGITADELGPKMVEIASGVIRKHLGKVE